MHSAIITTADSNGAGASSCGLNSHDTRGCSRPAVKARHKAKLTSPSSTLGRARGQLVLSLKRLKDGVPSVGTRYAAKDEDASEDGAEQIAIDHPVHGSSGVT